MAWAVVVSADDTDRERPFAWRGPVFLAFEPRAVGRDVAALLPAAARCPGRPPAAGLRFFAPITVELFLTTPPSSTRPCVRRSSFDSPRVYGRQLRVSDGGALLPEACLARARRSWRTRFPGLWTHRPRTARSRNHPSCRGDQRDVPCRFQHPVGYFLGRFDARRDRVDHADEDPLEGTRIAGDEPEHSLLVGFAGELDEEVRRVEAEEIGQQVGVIHVRAVRRVLVAAWTRVHADALPLRSVNRARTALFSSTNCRRSPREGSSFTARRPSVKSNWTLTAPPSKQLRISVAASSMRSLMNSSRL